MRFEEVLDTMNAEAPTGRSLDFERDNPDFVAETSTRQRLERIILNEPTPPVHVTRFQ